MYISFQHNLCYRESLAAWLKQGPTVDYNDHQHAVAFSSQCKLQGMPSMERDVLCHAHTIAQQAQSACDQKSFPNWCIKCHHYHDGFPMSLLHSTQVCDPLHLWGVDMYIKARTSHSTSQPQQAEARQHHSASQYFLPARDHRRRHGWSTPHNVGTRIRGQIISRAPL